MKRTIAVEKEVGLEAIKPRPEQKMTETAGTFKCAYCRFDKSRIEERDGKFIEVCLRCNKQMDDEKTNEAE